MWKCKAEHQVRVPLSLIPHPSSFHALIPSSPQIRSMVYTITFMASGAVFATMTGAAEALGVQVDKVSGEW